MQLNDGKLLSILPTPRASHSSAGKNPPKDAKGVIWQILGLLYQQQIVRPLFLFLLMPASTDTKSIVGSRERDWEKAASLSLSLSDQVRGISEKCPPN